MTQRHGCRKKLRKCVFVCGREKKREKGQRESTGSWGLAAPGDPLYPAD